MENPVRNGQLVGRGSTGKVYKAYFNGRTLALKSSYPSYYCYSALQKEESILRRLRHCPDIVDCFGGFSTQESDGAYNLLLEYSPEGSLASFLNRRQWTGLPEPQVQRFARMIVRGLSNIHKEGLVHGDLNLDNILVFESEDGEYKVKLADFGQASSTEKEEFRLTAELRQKDIFFLGCAVVDMFPSKKEVDDELIFRLIGWDQRPKIPENISEDGRDFLGKCLGRDPWWTADRLLLHPYIAEVPAGKFHEKKSIRLARNVLPRVGYGLLRFIRRFINSLVPCL